MTLAERRAEWERGLTVVAARTITSGFPATFVILKDQHGLYHCHRYFQIRDGGVASTEEFWEGSFDHQRVNAETAMRWALEQVVDET